MSLANCCYYCYCRCCYYCLAACRSWHWLRPNQASETVSAVPASNTYVCFGVCGVASAVSCLPSVPVVHCRKPAPISAGSSSCHWQRFLLSLDCRQGKLKLAPEKKTSAASEKNVRYFFFVWRENWYPWFTSQNLFSYPMIHTGQCVKTGIKVVSPASHLSIEKEKKKGEKIKKKRRENEKKIRKV